MADNPMIELKKTAESMKEELMANNPLSDIKNDLKAGLPDLAELKSDLPDLQQAAKRFQEQILDVQAEEASALPEKTAETGKAPGNGNASVTAADTLPPSELNVQENSEVDTTPHPQGTPLRTQANTDDTVRTDAHS